MIGRRDILRALALSAAAAAARPALADAPRRSPAPLRRGASGPPPAGGAALASAAGLSGEVGFALLDLSTGEMLDALNPERGFAPASVAKTTTTLYALAILGADHRFTTTLRAHGAISGGALKGDLTLEGGGDPELDSDALALMAARAAAQIARVAGRFHVSGAPLTRAIDPGQPPQAAYNPSVGALNVNFNRVRLKWEREGASLDAWMEAHAAGGARPVESVALDLAPPDCGCPIYERRDDAARERWRIRSSALRRDGSVFLPVREPQRYAAELFADAAMDAGLALPAPLYDDGPGGAALALHQSRPLRDILKDMLRFSTNLTAEAAGLAAARAAGARPETLAASAAAMDSWARALTDGAPGPVANANHSGLSAASRISPARMAALLAAADRAPTRGAKLAELLDDHEFGDRDARAPDGAAMVAKTGTLDFTRGLAGYLTAPSGRRFAFAYFANDLPRRAATRGADGPPPGGRSWLARARRLERALARNWLARFG